MKQFVEALHQQLADKRFKELLALWQAPKHFEKRKFKFKTKHLNNEELKLYLVRQIVKHFVNLLSEGNHNGFIAHQAMLRKSVYVRIIGTETIVLNFHRNWLSEVTYLRNQRYYHCNYFTDSLRLQKLIKSDLIHLEKFQQLKYIFISMLALTCLGIALLVGLLATRNKAMGFIGLPFVAFFLVCLLANYCWFVRPVNNRLQESCHNFKEGLSNINFLNFSQYFPIQSYEPSAPRLFSPSYNHSMFRASPNASTGEISYLKSPIDPNSKQISPVKSPFVLSKY